AAEQKLLEMHVENGAVLVGLGVIVDARHRSKGVGLLGSHLDNELQSAASYAVVELRPDRGREQAADAVYLAALHREQDIARARLPRPAAPRGGSPQSPNRRKYPGPWPQAFS